MEKSWNPGHSLSSRDIKGTRQKVIVMHYPSEIDQNQLFLVRFPNLGSNGTIVLGTTNLSFNTKLSPMADSKRALVSNMGRAISEKLVVSFEGNEILDMDDFDAFACYQDLWKTMSEKQTAVGQGIIHSSSCTSGCMKLWTNASYNDATRKQDQVITHTYGSKFVILLDFEMLDSMIPYYQLSLGNRLCYKIHVQWLWSSHRTPGKQAKPDVKYKIIDMSLEYKIINQPVLVR